MSPFFILFARECSTPPTHRPKLKCHSFLLPLSIHNHHHDKDEEKPFCHQPQHTWSIFRAPPKECRPSPPTWKTTLLPRIVFVCVCEEKFRPPPPPRGCEKWNFNTAFATLPLALLRSAPQKFPSKTLSHCWRTFTLGNLSPCKVAKVRAEQVGINLWHFATLKLSWREEGSVEPSRAHLKHVPISPLGHVILGSTFQWEG